MMSYGKQVTLGVISWPNPPSVQPIKQNTHKEVFLCAFI